jgi:hypothetical protein
VGDSGTNPVPDLMNVIGNHQAFCYQDSTGNGPQDRHGHGDHLAGIITERRKHRHEVIAAIDKAIENQYNIRVINLSLGRPVYGSYTIDPLCQARQAAWRAGAMKTEGTPDRSDDLIASYSSKGAKAGRRDRAAGHRRPREPRCLAAGAGNDLADGISF